ncbi:hypothetical protein ACI2TD_18160 [Ralstonia nicotianae]
MTSDISPPSLLEALRVSLAERLRAGTQRLPCADRYADELPDWRARASQCHDNVDRWLATHPGDCPVRGWLLHAVMGSCYELVAHSMARTQGGVLIDVTLDRKAGHSAFIEHPAKLGGFFALLCANPPHHVIRVCTGSPAIVDSPTSYWRPDDGHTNTNPTGGRASLE